MRRAILSVSMLALSLAAQAADPPAKQQTAEEKEIAGLIENLGADSWRVREKASDGLSALGRKPRAALIEAVKSPDPEVAMRARRLLAVILNDEVWDPVELEISVEKRKVSEIFASIGKQSGTAILWGPLTGHGDEPEDPTIDFEAKGSLPEVLDLLCRKSATRVVCPDGYGSGALRVVRASKDALPKANCGNLWVTIGSPPFRHADGSISVPIQFVAGGQQALMGVNLPLKIKAVTDSGETIEPTSSDRGSWLPVTRGSNRVISTRIELSAPRNAYAKIVKLEIEAVLGSYGDHRLVSFETPGKPSEQKQFGGVLSCDGLREYGKDIRTTTIKFDRHIYDTPTLDLVDAAGNKVAAHYVTVKSPWNPDDTSYEAYFHTGKLSEPARIDVRFYTRSAHKKVAVALHDIPVR